MSPPPTTVKKAILMEKLQKGSPQSVLTFKSSKHQTRERKGLPMIPQAFNLESFQWRPQDIKEQTQVILTVPYLNSRPHTHEPVFITTVNGTANHLSSMTQPLHM